MQFFLMNVRFNKSLAKNSKSIYIYNKFGFEFLTIVPVWIADIQVLTHVFVNQISRAVPELRILNLLIGVTGQLCEDQQIPLTMAKRFQVTMTTHTS